MGSNYCPAGYTPVTPANTLPPNITGVGYCQAPVAPVVAYTQPVTTRVAYVVPRGAVARVAYAYPRRAVALRVAYRTEHMDISVWASALVQRSEHTGIGVSAFVRGLLWDTVGPAIASDRL